MIEAWQSQGGVLLMGYELYRQLANRKARKRKVSQSQNLNESKTNVRQVNRAGESSDADEENRNLRILSGWLTLFLFVRNPFIFSSFHHNTSYYIKLLPN